MDPLARLTRKDKWFLGGGKGAIYAPPFPKHLATPGFWDECYLGDIRIPRLFAVLFLDERGSPIRLVGEVEEWRPDRLTLLHRGSDIVIRERRCVTEGNAWVSEFDLLSGGYPLNVFVWSLPEVRPLGHGTPWQSMTDIEPGEDSMRVRFETAWPGELEPDRTGIEQESIAASAPMDPALPLFLELGASLPRRSWTVNLAQRHDEAPLYELSVLPEKFARGSLPGDFKPFAGTEPVEGLAHVVQHYIWRGDRPFVVACGAGMSAEAAHASLNGAVLEGVIERSEESWRRYFAGVPQFSSSDDYLTNAYWYRWYGLRLNTVDLPLPVRTERGGGEVFAPFVTEGIGFFRNFVTYSAQAHLREVAWMHDPSLAVGILDNLAKVQRADGSFPGHSYSCRPPRDFYHFDITGGLVRLLGLHSSKRREEYGEMLRRYADYFVANRTQSADPTHAAMYDVFDQNETGQEYMSRYQFASDKADKWASFRVSGVDATVYAYRLFSTLSWLLPAADARPYHKYANGARNGLEEISYDPASRFFCDVLPDGRRSPARPATGLYPMLAPFTLWHNGGIPFEEIADRWLMNPDEFGLPAGFSATALSDATFSAEGEWKERRLNCPWNGRSWPMANSHLVDGLAQLTDVVGPTGSMPIPCLADQLRPQAAKALMKIVRLMFHNGDPARPNSYEHYDPITGVPALYRGYDDYMHSWIVDLILRHAVGVQPGTDHVDPLPLDVDWIECTDIPHFGGRMNVRIFGGSVSVEIVPYT